MNGEIHLPLHEATTLILLSLAGGPRHGYAILKEVEHLSEGRVRLSTGTLYGALTRLLDQGLISRQEKEGAIGGRTKKQYELTPLGTQVLHAVARRLEQRDYGFPAVRYEANPTDAALVLPPPAMPLSGILPARI
jgi:DNA-binding PadR family transcriptional regulator